MAQFVRSYKIRFEDCDYAGIVFYPNYFLMLNRLIEDWFSESLRLPWSIMHRDRRLGFPTVNLQVDFKKACRLDEMLEWSLEVRSLKTRSASLGVRACCQGELRVGIEITIVSVNLVEGHISSCAIPSDIRSGMEIYLADSGAA